MPKLNKKSLAALAEQYNAGRKARWIRVGMSTCGMAAGAGAVYDALKALAAGLPEPVDVRQCGCAGQCYAEPLVEVRVPGMPRVIYGRVTVEDARAIIEQHIEKKQLVQERIYNVQVIDEA